MAGFTQHFPNKVFDDIQDAATDCKLFKFPREVLFSGIDDNAWAFIANMGAAPFQLAADLQWLNTTERLGDGMVPFVRWLENAARHTRATCPKGSAVFARYADSLAQVVSGQPPMPDPADLPETKESVIFEDDIMPYPFLLDGYEAGMSVVHLEVPELEGGNPRTTDAGAAIAHRGTGWLFAPNHVMTNHHVVKARDGNAQPTQADFLAQGLKTKVTFDYNSDTASGTVVPVETVEAWNADLDYAILRLAGNAGYPALPRIEGLFTKGDGYVTVNIIQHPDGGFKQIAIRNNVVTATTAKDVRYFTATRRGSSGSPVFDDKWRVVALHRGSARIANVQFQGKSVAYVNLGTQINAIVADLQTNWNAAWKAMGA